MNRRRRNRYFALTALCGTVFIACLALLLAVNKRIRQLEYGRENPSGSRKRRRDRRRERNGH